MRNEGIPNSFFDDLTGSGGMLGMGLGGLLGSLFGGQSGPDPMSYLNQITGQAGQYLKPYSEAGQGMLPGLEKQYGALTNDPGGMLNEIGSQYHQSPGFNFSLQQALKGANQGAAAGGMAGSPMAQQQNMQIGTQLGNQDYYNWLGKAQGMYGTGLQGMQNMAGQGLESGMGLSNLISQALATQAQQAYANRANNQQSGGGIGGLLGDLAGGAMSFFGL